MWGGGGGFAQVGYLNVCRIFVVLVVYTCGYVVCSWVRVIEGMKGVHGIGYVSEGFCLL